MRSEGLHRDDSDAAFNAEANKLDLDLEPIDGAQIDPLLRNAYAAPQNVIEAARTAISAN